MMKLSRKHLGDKSDTPLIDQLPHAMQLWKEEKRRDLVNYLRENELLDHFPYWKLAQALFEVLPRDEEDWKLISSLLGERELSVRSKVLRATKAAAEGGMSVMESRRCFVKGV